MPQRVEQIKIFLIFVAFCSLNISLQHTKNRQKSKLRKLVKIDFFRHGITPFYDTLSRLIESNDRLTSYEI